MPSHVGLYIYGNSLVSFAEGNSETNVPIWMNQFAAADGNSLAVSGGYGFLRNFADRDTPGSEWGFEGVTPSWNSEIEAFGASAVDTVLITPNNFIQDVSPGTDYIYDTRSPLDATLETIADTQADLPTARIFIYEGWADMAGFAPDGVPNDPSALAAYHTYNQGDYHQWYVDYTAQLNAMDGDANVTLIPVASVLSELMTTTLADVSPEALYVDTAPHGTETVYFLASMVTYSAMYGVPAPANAAIPNNIDPAVAANYPEIADLIFARVQEAADNVQPPETIDDVVPEDPGTEDPSDPETPQEPVDPVIPVDPTPEQPTDPEPVDPAPEVPTDPGTPASDDSVEVAADQTVLIDVLANDGAGMRLVYIDAPMSGQADIQDNMLLYTAPGSGGADSLHYTVQDTDGAFYEAALSISVTEPDQDIAPEQPSDPTIPDMAPAFVGTLGIAEDGSYNFDVYADDLPGIVIDGQPLVLSQDVPGIMSASLDLTAGDHDFAVYYDAGIALEEVTLLVNGPSAPSLTIANAEVTETEMSEDAGAALINALQLANEPEVPVDESSEDDMIELA